jgi:hypothetical protein
MIRVRVRVVNTCSVFHIWWRIHGAINGAGKFPLITYALQRLIRLGLGLGLRLWLGLGLGLGFC